MIAFRCPDCTHRHQAPEQFAGKRIRCKGCSRVLTIEASVEGDVAEAPVVDAAPAPAASKKPLRPGTSVGAKKTLGKRPAKKSRSAPPGAAGEKTAANRKIASGPSTRTWVVLVVMSAIFVVMLCVVTLKFLNRGIPDAPEVGGGGPSSGGGAQPIALEPEPELPDLGEVLSLLPKSCDVVAHIEVAEWQKLGSVLSMASAGADRSTPLSRLDALTGVQFIQQVSTVWAGGRLPEGASVAALTSEGERPEMDQYVVLLRGTFDRRELLKKWRAAEAIVEPATEHGSLKIYEFKEETGPYYGGLLCNEVLMFAGTPELAKEIIDLREQPSMERSSVEESALVGDVKTWEPLTVVATPTVGEASESPNVPTSVIVTGEVTDDDEAVALSVVLEAENETAAIGMKVGLDSLLGMMRTGSSELRDALQGVSVELEDASLKVSCRIEDAAIRTLIESLEGEPGPGIGVGAEESSDGEEDVLDGLDGDGAEAGDVDGDDAENDLESDEEPEEDALEEEEALEADDDIDF